MHYDTTVATQENNEKILLALCYPNDRIEDHKLVAKKRYTHR